ncbi:MAG: hypothetical protein MPL62_14660, partial [Alphaproteobacteria bacterium]|nr:hypothetical protein [Alphaproteobacteria bacterium]
IPARFSRRHMRRANRATVSQFQKLIILFSCPYFTALIERGRRLYMVYCAFRAAMPFCRDN